MRGRRGVSIHQKTRNTEVIDQIIMIEPLGTDILFCLRPPLEIRGNFPHLLVDQGEGIHLPTPPQGRYYYEVSSALPSHEKEYQGSTGRPDGVYLQLPEKNGKEISVLTHQIIKQAISPTEKVYLVIFYLQHNYTYSLKPKRDERFLPLEDFLLHSREGYCEHFATAAALLLRAAGVPTRLVSGFLQGEWNSLGRYFMVRQRDAHTWIEAYLPDKGWASFDPTPVATAQAPPPLVSSLYRYYDFLKLKWNRYIVQYSRRDQIRFLLAFRQKVMDLRFLSQASPFRGAREKTLQSPAYLLAALAVIALIVLIGWGFKKRRGVLTGHRSRSPSEIYFYLKTLKILEKKKIIKRASETPAEFANRVIQGEDNRARCLQRITSLYYRVRFGLAPLTQYEVGEVQEIIRNLKKTPLSRHGVT
jgi:hypothetical protein